MSLSDIFRMALHNLWRRRLRTSLNLIGVVIGSVVLLMTSAGTRGARDAIHAMFDASELARQISIHPNYRPDVTPPESALLVEGEMTGERRTRIRDAMAQKWKSDYFASKEQESPIWMITPEQLQRLSGIQHVSTVIPDWYNSCRVLHDGPELVSRIIAADVTSDLLRQRLLAGEMLADGDQTGMLIDEFLAYQLGYRSDAQLSKIVGQQLSIEVNSGGAAMNVFATLSKLNRAVSGADLGKMAEYMAAGRQLLSELDSTSLSDSQKQLLRDTLSNGFLQNEHEQPLVIRRSFIIRGVLQMGLASTPMAMIQDHLETGNPGVYLCPETALSISKEQPEFKGFSSAVVLVDKTSHLQSVTEELKRLNYTSFSALWLLENIDFQIDQSQWVLYGIAAAILLTAAVGISNTLVISVLERTPEFGIMKAVGAKDRHLILLMLSEGAMLGLLGALIAIAVSLGGSVLISGIVRHYVQSRLSADLSSGVFQFSSWTMLFVIVCSAFICTLASVLPAWRASRLDPVVAMRRT